MGRRKTSRGLLLAANLPQLQNLIKRDPEGYHEEFLQQLRHFESIRHIIELKPAEESDTRRFRELIGFISQVAQCYPKETAALPMQLAFLLNEKFSLLTSDVQEALIRSLVLLRTKHVYPSVDLLRTLFPLLSLSTSPELRAFIRNAIISDVKLANLKSKDHKLNSAAQAILFTMVEHGMDNQIQGDKGSVNRRKPSTPKDGPSEEGMWAVSLAKEFWTKRIWDDAKTVSIVSLACFHSSIKVQKAAIHFFLGEMASDESESDDEVEVPDVRSLQRKHQVTKKTASSERRLAKSLKAVKKKAEKSGSQTAANYPALKLLHDPQGFSERLFASLDKHDNHFILDHKLLLIQLLTRVMGLQRTFVLGFYTYITRYVNYHQIRVTVILASLAQSVHELTPPDILDPILRKITQEFVHPGVGSEVIAAGLNSIREVCRRQPWCMDADLLGDLIEYRKSKDKGVINAARGLLQLFRDVNPSLLKRRERGKTAAIQLQAGARVVGYGYIAVPQRIEGLELLNDHIKAQGSRGIDDSEDNQWVGWDTESDHSENCEAGGWIDVESDGSSIDISGTEDEDDRGPVNLSKDQSHRSGKSIHSQVLATTKILTPADFAQIETLRLQFASEIASGGAQKNKRKLGHVYSSENGLGMEEPPILSETDILGPSKKFKASYAERLESVHKGREGRPKFGSSKGKMRNNATSSSTNREKARQKPLMMILASGAVRGKKMASLREKQKKLRAHIDRGKRAVR